MLSERMLEELNKQLNYEIYSAYLYVAMENYFQERNLEGFANFFKVQMKEELSHARIFYEYIYRMGGKVTLYPIEKPEENFGSILDVFKKALEHEKTVTQRIHKLVDLAIEERDHATNAFLQWFVNEQVEEEESFQKIINKLELIGDSMQPIFMLDSELAKRTFVLPAPLAKSE
ncbi:MAG: ferritin [Caldanaerobacter sp.]|nr:ferritin [Caldanaerobacter sp.]